MQVLGLASRVVTSRTNLSLTLDSRACDIKTVKKKNTKSPIYTYIYFQFHEKKNLLQLGFIYKAQDIFKKPASLYSELILHF